MGNRAPAQGRQSSGQLHARAVLVSPRGPPLTCEALLAPGSQERSANPRTGHCSLRTQNFDTTRIRRTMLDYERVTAPLSLRTRSGEPLLLLHGLGTSRRDFTAVIPALIERFDVINVDLPGIGRSPHLEQRPTVAAITDAVEHTLDAAGLDRVHVLGNSLGARIALELAVRGRARSVVAIAPS